MCDRSGKSFPELTAIDEEIRILRRTLKNPELSQRHRNGYEGLLRDCLKKRRKFLDGIKRRV